MLSTCAAMLALTLFSKEYACFSALHVITELAFGVSIFLLKLLMAIPLNGVDTLRVFTFVFTTGSEATYCSMSGRMAASS